MFFINFLRSLFAGLKNMLYICRIKIENIMSQSSPEGIILGKGSKLVSLELSINKEKVLEIKEKPNTFLGWLGRFKKK